jgi:hypothetical protein
MPATIKAITLRKLKSHVDLLLDTLYFTQHSIFKATHRRYTDFVINLSEVDADGHTGKHSDNRSGIKYNPHAKGDKWSSLTAVIQAPALQFNPGTTDQTAWISKPWRKNEAYYVQNTGIAFFTAVNIISGSTPGPDFTDQDNYFQYQMLDPHADDPIDSRIFRYSTVSELKQVSSGNVLMHVPIYHNQIRFDNIAGNYAMHAVLKQSTELQTTMRPLSELTVNEGNLTMLPYKRGTTTPIQSSDFTVRFFSHFLIMSPEERRLQKYMWLSQMGMHHKFNYFKTFEQSDASAMGSEVKIKDFSPNHPCPGMYVYYRTKKYTDKTMVSPQGVGLVNYYDYSASHGGETLYGLDLLYNDSSYLEQNHPISWMRTSWNMHHEKMIRPFSTIYFINYATKLDSDNPDKTVNHSNIEKVTVRFIKNVPDEGTWVLRLFIHNVFSYKSGFGGQQFI